MYLKVFSKLDASDWTKAVLKLFVIIIISGNTYKILCQIRKPQLATSNESNPNDFLIKNPCGPLF